MARQPLVGQGLLMIEASRSHSDTPHSVRLLWTSDQPDAETSISTSTHNTHDKYICPWQGFEPASQQASGRRRHDLDRAATGIGKLLIIPFYKFLLSRYGTGAQFINTQFQDLVSNSCRRKFAWKNGATP
jgi:hypothetical protein